MKFSQEKKQLILLYLLEQIALGRPDLSKTVAEKCEISRNAVINYLAELTESGIIQKTKRGCYSLVTKTEHILLKREQGELSSDTYAFHRYFEPYLDGCTEEARHLWEYAFSEMANNVMVHSGAEALSLMIEKNYFQIRVCMFDDGIGIFEKIKNHFGLSTIIKARAELFKGKLTPIHMNDSVEKMFLHVKNTK